VDAKKVAETAIFAALYASLTILLAPISFYSVQVRVADMLLPLVLDFGLPLSIGVSIGCFVANMLGPFGLVDALGGSAANLIATLIALLLRRFGRKGEILASLELPVVVSLVVSSYLQFLLNLPFPITFAYILAGSLVSMTIMGFLGLRPAVRKFLGAGR